MPDMTSDNGGVTPPGRVIAAGSIRRWSGDANPPLSFAQRRLWFLEQLLPDTSTYNVNTSLRLRGTLDIDALNWALTQIVSRHSALRASFSAPNGTPLQHIAPPAEPFPLRFTDLSDVVSRDRETLAIRLAAEEAQRTFDLDQGPLIRARLLRLDEQDHLLAMSVHHIVFDGWSLGVLYREFAALYAARLAGLGNPLPPLDIQYGDYAAWQHDGLVGDRLRAEVAFWLGQLDGAPTVLDLPTDRKRPSSQTMAGAVHGFELSDELWIKIKQCARARRVTPYMVMLAAYAALLSRLTGVDDLLVGTPVGGRTARELEPLIGLFVNTVPVRVDLTGDVTFEEVLTRVRRSVLGVLSHQQLPFERLVEELRPDRVMSRNPLMQTVFSFETPAAPVSLPGLSVEPLRFPTGSAKFDLTLGIEATVHGVHAEWEYSTDLFESSSMERMAGYYLRLLDAAVTEPATRVHRLTMLGDEQRQQILTDWSRRTGPSHDGFVHDLFARRASETPNAVAVVCGADRVTYRDLNRRANRISHLLRQRGAQPDAVVAIMLPRGVQVLASVLGVLKAGAAYLPLDPDDPPVRLRAMLDGSGAGMVLTTSDLADSLADAAIDVITVDDPALNHLPVHDPDVAIHAENLAYVTYTSGSTGRPKAVAVPHRALTHHAHTIRGYFGLSAADRVLQFAGMTFDVAAEEIYPTWLGGGEVVVLANSAIPPADLEVFLRDHRITVVNLPTPYWEEWTRDLAVRPRRLLDSLRLVVIGSDAGSADALARWYTRTDIPVINAYGLTETTITSTLYPTDGPTSQTTDTLAIGSPVPGVRAYVLDRHLQLVPHGIVGELYVAGPTLARGYLRAPDQTAERFVPDPFSDVGGGRMCRTGDQARWGPDGTLEFLGRADDQIKIRGYRMEPREIETALRLHHHVRDAVVRARTDRPGHPELVAYVITAEPPGDPQSAGTHPGNELFAELRRHLGRLLPAYMVPMRIVTLERFPLTPSGKIDDRALPATQPGPPGEHEQSAGPADPVAQLLAATWAEVLGLPRVGANDNFFELGGDSIRSIQVVARVRAAGLPLTTQHMFRHQTISELALEMRNLGSTPEPASAVDTVPFTPAQRAMLADYGGDASRLGHVVVAEPAGRLEPTLIEQELGYLLERHSALRLRLVPAEPAWRVLPGPAAGGPDAQAITQHVDLSGENPSSADRAVDAVAAELQTRIDLSSFGPLQVALLDLGPTRPQQLLIAVNRLVLDAPSVEQLAAALISGAGQPAVGRAPRVAAPTAFHLWARRMCETADPELPVRSTAAVVPAGVDRARIVVPEDETRILTGALATAYRMSISEILLAALAVAHRSSTGESTLVVTVERSGRALPPPDLDLSHSLGQFDVRVPMTLRLGGEADPVGALLAVKEHLRAVPGWSSPGFPVPAAAEKPNEHAWPTVVLRVNEVAPSPSAWLRVIPAADGGTEHAGGESSHAVRVNASVRADTLQVDLARALSPGGDRAVERLAGCYTDALKAFVEHARSSQAGACTPSDFPFAGLDQPTLSALFGTGHDVEDVYPVGPLQEWMLWQLKNRPRNGLYVLHESFDLTGAEVDPEALLTAWQQIVENHPVLRTSFLWDGVERPLQVIHRNAPIPVHREDWRGLSDQAQKRRMARYLAGLHRRGFDLGRAPQVKLALMRRRDDCHRLIWAFNYIVIDGWTFPHLLEELFALHDGLRQNHEILLPARRPFRDHIEWIAGQNGVAAEKFWRSTLSGFTSTTPLVASLGGGTDRDDNVDQRARLSVAQTTAVRSQARRHQLTLHTLVQGAYALLLGANTDAEDVVFGSVVSGRSHALAGVEQMVGCLNNVVPSRVRLSLDQPLIAWLRSLQAQHVDIRQYEYVSPLHIKQYSEVPEGQDLYESHLVFENFPFESTLRERLQGWNPVGNGAQGDESLRVTVWPDPALLVIMSYSRRDLGDREVCRLLRDFLAILVAMSESLGQSVGDFLRSVGAAA